MGNNAWMGARARYPRSSDERDCRSRCRHLAAPLRDRVMCVKATDLIGLSVSDWTSPRVGTPIGSN